MARASFMQTNFLGGLWSKLFQGRVDNPNYKSAMNACLNGYPIEEGAWLRRSGSRLMAPTFKGLQGRLYPVAFTTAAPYQTEWTDDGTNGYLRFFNSNYLVCTEEVNFMAGLSTAKPAVLTLQSPVVGWATGDEIAFIPPQGLPGTTITQLRQRTFIITVQALTTPSAWSGTYQYQPGDQVSETGVNYICIKASLNNIPPNATYWSVLPAGAIQSMTLADSITGLPLDGSTVTLGIPVGVAVLRALRLTTPYVNGTWENIRIVQNQELALVLHGGETPQVLQINPNIGSNQAANASLTAARFLDGPYLDPILGSNLTVTGTTGIVGVTAQFQAYVSGTTYMLGDYVTSGGQAYQSLVGGNLGNTPASSPADWKAVGNGLAVTGNPYTDPATWGFQQTDVGRQIRMLCTPTPWQAGTYVTGNEVYWQQLAYKCTTDGTTTQPDLDPVGWNVDPSGLYWTWGTITTVINDHNVDVQVQGNPVLYPGVTIQTWRLGVYSTTSGQPTCGIFAQGRFWLGGALPNRFDACMSEGVLADGRIVMSPTGPGAAVITAQLLDDGSVNDNNGISYTLNSKEKNPIYWWETDKNGLLAGTEGGEWLVSSTNGADPITPLNIQANKVSKYGCANIEPKRTGIALVFVQKFKRRIMEFLSDVFTGRYTAPHLTESAKNLTKNQVQELGYQEELAPIIWARVNPCAGEGGLIGATYRRVSAFTTEAPKFVGWHQHTLGTDRCFESISVGANVDGTLDALSFVTGDPLLQSSQGLKTQVRWVETMTQMFDEDDSIYDAWFLDGGIIPDTMYADTVAGAAGQRFTGLWQWIGESVTLYAGGLDLGEYTVDTNGTIFVPYGTGIAPASINYCQSGSGKWKFTAAYIAYILGLSLPNRNPVASSTVTTTTTPPTITPSTNPNNSSKIQSFLPANGQGANDWGFAVDWGAGYLIASYGTNATGATAYNLTTGADHARQAFAWDSSSSGTDGKGNWYHTTSSGNYVPLVSTVEASMTNTYSYGSGGSFGPPNNSGVGVPYGGQIMVLTANASWVVTVGSGSGITLNQGTTGHYIAGNGATQPQYEGLGAQPWNFNYTGGGTSVLIAPGAPTYQNNLATGYALNCGGAYVTTGTDVWVIGVADGVPTQAQNTLNTGKKGKGKSKKGAGLGTIPSTDTPDKIFYQLGTIHGPMIDPLWQDAWGIVPSGMVIDQFDNSIIAGFRLQFDGGAGNIPGYSATTLYNFNPAPTSKWPLVQETDPSGKTLLHHAVNDIFTNGVHAYITILDAPIGTLITNATYFTQMTTWNKQGTDKYAFVTDFDGSSYVNQDMIYAALQDNIYGVDPTVHTNQGCSSDTVLKPWMPIQPNYIVKITTGQASRQNTGTFGVAWAVPVYQTPYGSGWNQGQVKGGLFGWMGWKHDGQNLDGSYNIPVYLINTVTGGWYSVDIGSVEVGATEWQAWDDQSESVIYFGQYVSSTGSNAPSGLNGTTSDGTNTHWYRLYIGSNAPASPTFILQPESSACVNPLVQPVLSGPPNPQTFVFPNTIFGPGVYGPCNAVGGFPAVAGKTFTSQGQILRQIAPEASGSRLGPAFGQTRRTHYWTGLLHNTVQMQYGVDFGASLTCMTLKDGQDGNTGNQIQPGAMFEGFVRYPLKDGYTYDSMLSWQVTRPFPATLISVGGMLETNDV